MQKETGALLLAFIVLACRASAGASAVRVNNRCGSITAKVTAERQIRITHSSPARESRKDDVILTQEAGVVAIRCQPADGAPVDITVSVPYGVALAASTQSGALTLEGLATNATLETGTGELRLTAPWQATRLTIQAANAPREVITPRGIKFSERRRPPGWVLRDRLPGSRVTSGYIRVTAESPARVVLADMEIPEDSPVKLPWQAPAILEEILTGVKTRKMVRNALPPAATREQSVEESTPIFRSDVRMVNLLVAVSDAKGNPVRGLKPEDFEVIEDGVRQEVAFAGAEEVPFNLAVLLDLSGSTLRDRPAMKEAARRFIGITQPHDRVALYALANDLFQVIFPLTADRDELLSAIESLPDLSGGTPLYDSIVLAYNEELRRRPEERNALVVISDGLDNRIQGEVNPSKVSFGKLKRGVVEMHALIYPIFLDPFDKVPPPPQRVQARAAMQELADASGGRLFPAHSVRDLEPVYPLVASELRSVYSVAYYPKNQTFDGRWRSVQVRVKRPEARPRTRAGYIAR